MRVSIVRGGGVAGIATRTELAADSLSANDASALRAKVEAAGLAHLADDVPARPQPDDLLYELRLEDEAVVHTVHFAESTLPEAVRSLITWVDSMPAAEHGRA